MAQVLTIDGSSRRARLATLNIEATANGIDTLVVDVPSLDGSYRPAVDDEVTFEDGAEVVFGGIITKARERGILEQPVDGIFTEIEASDFNRLADERVLTFEFPSQTLKERLEDIVDEVLGDAGVTLASGQVDGPTLEATSYRLARVTDILNELATLAGGWVWEIDPSKELSMIEPGTVAAPFNITVGSGNIVSDLTVEPTRNDYANAVYVDAGSVIGFDEDTGAQSSLGRIIDAVVSAPDTTTQEQADALATAYLAAHLPTLKRVTYQTTQGGLRPGMTQTITIPARNVNNTFLVSDISIRSDGVRLWRRVSAIEGLVYQTGWREFYRRGALGDRAAGSMVFGGGSGAQRFAYPLASGVEAVESPTPTWVPASALEVQINTVPRGTLSATVVVRLRALNSGIGVQARIFDVTDNAACAGTSSTVTSTSFQLVTFTATLTAGSHVYRLELLPSAANEPVMAAGYLE